MRELAVFLFKSLVTLFSGYGLGYKIPFARKIVNYTTNKLKKKSDKVTVYGHNLTIDENDSLQLSIWPNYEPLIADIFYSEVKTGDVVLDIGANIGVFTLLGAKLVGSEGSVYAFEPDPENFSLLTQNVNQSRYKNITLVNKAVNSQTCPLKLYQSESNRGDHQIHDSGQNRKFISVQGVAIDDYFDENEKRVKLIKMDIQGAEWDAIQGMSNILNQDHPLIIISELWPFGLLRAGVSTEIYLSFMKERNFEIFHINHASNQLIKMDIDNVIKLFHIEDTEWSSNLLFTRT